jgi:uncharacterized repeat protein (TIGR03803 family)
MTTLIERTKRALLLLPFAALLALLTAPALEAQTYTVIHSFTGGEGGSYPQSGVTLDQAGNLYGTAAGGAADPYGVVYKMTRVGSNWLYTPIYQFRGFPDAEAPQSRVIFGPDGALYGTTLEGGDVNMGTVYRLAPQPTFCRSALCSWNETILHSFQGAPDGANPGTGDLLFDPSGNLYGTTQYGGMRDQSCMESYCGTAFELQHTNGTWQESVIYQFAYSTGFNPMAGFIRDSSGNLYSTTTFNPAFGGTVYELSPSGRGWTPTFLYSSPGSFSELRAGLVFDSSGNLYGAFGSGGVGEGGGAFELAHSGSSWTYVPVWDFNGPEGGPQAALTVDAAGNLYGTTAIDGPRTCGAVFKLTPSGGSWTYTSLHNFTCGSDGEGPVSNVSFDASGNMYGTTSGGGAYGKGVIWEIIP